MRLVPMVAFRMEFDRETSSVTNKERLFRNPQEYKTYSDFRTNEIAERVRLGPKL